MQLVWGAGLEQMVRMQFVPVIARQSLLCLSFAVTTCTCEADTLLLLDVLLVAADWADEI